MCRNGHELNGAAIRMKKVKTKQKHYNNWKKKYDISHLKNLGLLHYPGMQVSYYVTTPNYQISSLLSVKWSLLGGYSQKEIFNF